MTSNTLQPDIAVSGATADRKALATGREWLNFELEHLPARST
jgi:hypothetical protein